MDTITRDNCKVIRAELEKAIPQLEKALGLKIKVAGGTYDANGAFATFKVEFATIGENGEVQSREAESFKSMATLYGLKPDDLGKVFKSWDGREYTIVGLRPKATKMPIIVSDANGRRFKMSGEQVNFGLKKKG